MGQENSGPKAFADLIDLASERMGGRTLAASDEFFAPKDNLLKAGRAVFVPDRYTERGKWMDGWESRRKRTPGHDWCIIALGAPGSIAGVNVDTAHFNGNQPEFCTVEATEIAGAAGPAALKRAAWSEIVPRTPLRPSSEHFIHAATSLSTAGHRFTHVRLNIFPDGGVARLRVFGRVLADWEDLARSEGPIELSSAANGGLVVAANNMHFGSRHNLIMPGRAKNMGDGWETRRKRGLNWHDGRPIEHDWAIVQLARRGTISKVEVDTNHFKGNFPESCRIEVCDGVADHRFGGIGAEWPVLLPRTRLMAGKRHFYTRELDRACAARPCTHARLSIYPDGGVSRLRLWGRPSPQ